MPQDNTVLNSNTTVGDLIRTVLNAITGAKTQVMKLDVGGETTEVFCNGQVPVTFSSPLTQSIGFRFTSAQNNNPLISPVGAQIGKVTRITVTTSNTTFSDVAFRAGFGTGTTPTGAGVVLSSPGMGNNSQVDAGDGLGTLGQGTAGQPFLFTCSDPGAGGGVDVNLTYSVA